MYLADIRGNHWFKSKVYEQIKFIEDKVQRPVLLKHGSYPIYFSFEEINDADKMNNPDSPDDNSLGVAIIHPNFCIITINKNVPWIDENFKLVLLHEIGHCIGLDHPTTDFGSIMDARDEFVDKELEDVDPFLQTVNSLVEEGSADPVILNDDLIKYPLVRKMGKGFYRFNDYPFSR